MKKLIITFLLAVYSVSSFSAELTYPLSLLYGPKPQWRFRRHPDAKQTVRKTPEGGVCVTTTAGKKANQVWLLLKGDPALEGIKFEGIRFSARIISPDGKDQRLALGLSGIDLKGKKSNFAARFLATKEFKSFTLAPTWAKYNSMPDYSKLELIKIKIPPECTLEIKNLELAMMKNPASFKRITANAAENTPEPVTIDGKQTDSVWSKTPWIKIPGKGDEASWKAAWDDKNLYLLCRRKFTKPPKTSIKAHDAPVWQDDAFEFYLRPRSGMEDTYMIVVNSADFRFELSSERARDWNGPLTNKSTVSGNEWLLELAIPFASLGAEKVTAGDAVGINIRSFDYNSGAKAPKVRQIIEKNRVSGLLSALVLKPGGWKFTESGDFSLQIQEQDINMLIPVVKESENFVLSARIPGAKNILRKTGELLPGSVKSSIKTKFTNNGVASLFMTLMNKQRRTIGFYGCAIEVSTPFKPMKYGELVLWPIPQECKLMKGHFKLGKELTYTADEKCPENVLRLFEKQMQKLFNIKVKRGGNNAPVKLAVGGAAANLKNEGFTLDVGTDKIVVNGKDPAGLYYGVRTLLQLVEKSTLFNQPPVARCVKVRDWPDTPNRIIFIYLNQGTYNFGQMSDVKLFKEYLYRVVAGARYNRIILAFNGSFKYKSYPKLAERNAASPETVREIADFARENYITPIPGSNSPGHAGWICSRYPELGEDGSRNVLCTRNPESKKLVLSVYDEIIEAVGPGNLVHLGHDEIRWETSRKPEKMHCKLCKGIAKKDLLLEEIKFLRDKMRDKGRRVMIWNDMLTAAWNGGGEYRTADILPELPRDVIMMPWGRVGETAKPFAQMGFTVMRANTGFPQKKLGEFFKDAKYLQGDGLAIFSKFSWLSFNHIEPFRTANYWAGVQFINGCGIWNHKVFRNASLNTLFGRYGRQLESLYQQTPRYQDAKLVQVGLDEICTMPLAGTKKDGWFGNKNGMNLANFPKGNQVIAGVPFVFNGKAAVPEKAIKPIAVNDRIRAFVAMNTAQIKNIRKAAQLAPKKGSPRGLQLGQWVITYQDGSKTELPVSLGYNIYTWNGYAFCRYPIWARWTWLGNSPVAEKTGAGNYDVNVQQTEFVNPLPEKPVKSLTLVNRGLDGNNMKIILLGLTLIK